MYTAKGTLQRTAGIEQYLPMVRRQASKMIGRLPANVELDDLIQAGTMGLMDAMQRYEQGHGAEFETFAMLRVRGAMLDELRGADWVPRSVRKSQRGIAEAVHKLEQRLRRAPKDTEIAAELKVSLEQYHDMLTDVRGAQLVYMATTTRKTASPATWTATCRREFQPGRPADRPAFSPGAGERHHPAARARAVHHEHVLRARHEPEGNCRCAGCDRVPRLPAAQPGGGPPALPPQGVVRSDTGRSGQFLALKRLWRAFQGNF